MSFKYAVVGKISDEVMQQWKFLSFKDKLKKLYFGSERHLAQEHKTY